MCIVIDTNTFASVFRSSSSDHGSFSPIKDWIFKNKGKVVYGGTTYLNELSRDRECAELFIRLRRINKAIVLDKAAVDGIEKALKRKTSKSFNDHHLIAIHSESKCKLLCSKNTKDFPHILNKDYYPKNVSPPKIYSQSTHKHLLQDSNIATVCKPCSRASSEERKTLLKK